jgi:hypothetical protein
MRHLLVVAVLAGCSKPDPEPPAPQSTPEPPPPRVKMSLADQGSCTVTATGALDVEETSGGGPAAVSSKYWLAETEKTGTPAGLVVNCGTKQLRVSIVTKPDTTVPFGPKTYGDRELVLLARAGTGKPLTEVTGTVEVTAFDRAHVAGTIALTGKQVKGGAVTLAGHFDLKCAGYGGCAH